jgi:hypothetical protein
LSGTLQDFCIQTTISWATPWCMGHSMVQNPRWDQCTRGDMICKHRDVVLTTMCVIECHYSVFLCWELPCWTGCLRLHCDGPSRPARQSCYVYAAPPPCCRSDLAQRKDGTCNCFRRVVLALRSIFCLTPLLKSRTDGDRRSVYVLRVFFSCSSCFLPFPSQGDTVSEHTVASTAPFSCSTSSDFKRQLISWASLVSPPYFSTVRMCVCANVCMHMQLYVRVQLQVTRTSTNH